MSGYIKMFRKMLEWEWYKDTNTKALFLHILLRANWGLQKFQGQMVYGGQLVTTLRHLSDETGMSMQAVRTAINHLKSTHEIKVESTNKFTVITVEKWHFYQIDEGDINTLNDD